MYYFLCSVFPRSWLTRGFFVCCLGFLGVFSLVEWLPFFLLFCWTAGPRDKPAGAPAGTVRGIVPSTDRGPHVPSARVQGGRDASVSASTEEGVGEVCDFSHLGQLFCQKQKKVQDCIKCSYQDFYFSFLSHSLAHCLIQSLTQKMVRN